MTRDEALQLVRRYLKSENLVKHVIATGACMRRLAPRFGGDPERWELAGLLHDLDYEWTKDDFERHARETVRILREDLGFQDEEILNAILAHAEKKPLETPMEQVLYAVDPTTGFIVACALMHPEKRLAALDLGFMKRRFKEKRFARGANRDQIRSIEQAGLDLDTFLTECLEAMKEVHQDLGL